MTPDEPKNPAPENTGPVSINEPPGSQVSPASAPTIGTGTGKPPPPPAPPKELPSDTELHAMTRAELDALAKKRGIDSTEVANKAEVIELLKKG